jgi:hypothetical protein
MGLPTLNQFSKYFEFSVETWTKGLILQIIWKSILNPPCFIVFETVIELFKLNMTFLTTLSLWNEIFAFPWNFILDKGKIRSSCTKCVTNIQKCPYVEKKRLRMTDEVYLFSK